MDNNMMNIPAEKFQFATRNDLYHDSKFETKPVSYFQGAFKRFSKNKGAVVGGAFGADDKKEISVTSKGAVFEENTVLLPGEMI